ncbi:branched-chain amino acid ABC transporter permease [Saccharospirillum sp.]|uniref:branched-chain amino acid ABC transporter permease n=1 Tax=Saccharospirillum sp. TaxID=2033801 RepID=UPI0034A01DA5
MFKSTLLNPKVHPMPSGPLLHRYPLKVWIVMGLLILVLLSYPLWGEFVFDRRADFFLEKLTTIVIFALFALSLDLLVGIVGLVSLGHALFFGLGAYTFAMTSPAFSPASIWWMLPLVLGVSGCLALIVGFLVMRTKGIFFIMTTLAFGQMLYFAVRQSREAGGTDGLFIMFRPEVAIGDWMLINLDNPVTFFYAAICLLILTFAFLRWLTLSYFGQVLDGIHDNEDRMRALGYHTLHYKLTAYVLSGMIAAVAGMLSAMQYGFANPSQAEWHLSGEVLMMVILGGMGTLFGPILGAFAYELLHFSFEHLTTHWKLLMGVTIIVAVLVLPRGLAGLLIDPPRLSRSRVKPASTESRNTADTSRETL